MYAMVCYQCLHSLNVLVRNVHEGLVQSLRERAAAHPEHSLDKLIAATALIHDLTVVTRNVDDFAGTGARVLNPFKG